MIDNDSWIYVGEGGKHVVFSSTSREWKGRLLRVRREDLTGMATSSSSSSSSSSIKTSVEYLRRIVHPLLQPYFDVPELIELSPDTARKLMEQAIESGKIPQSRLVSWTLKPTLRYGDPDSLLFATLLHDYKQIAGHEGSYWSFEIKPKAGYLAFSPLIDPRHRLKCEQTRFSIQQQLLTRGIVQKGWTSVVTQPSAYNPLDLFSCDETRVKTALEALLDNPQNNLKIWHNEILILGHGVPAQQIPKEQATSLLCALSLVLREESVLTKLLRTQLLDVIDGDGAVILYNHLVELCNDDQTQVHELLDSAPSEVIVDEALGCLGASPFPRPKSATLDLLLSQVERFSAEVSTAEERDVAYHRIQGQISELSKLDCIFLLQNWLLSLTMCDVSVFVALAPSETAQNGTTPENALWQFKGHQIDKRPGLLQSTNGEWVYNVKVVDCDNKPASKLRKRGKKEAVIRKL